MNIEHSLVLIKPDGVELSLTGEVLSHLEREDIHLIGMKAVEPSQELAALHYFEHRSKPFYSDIIKYLMGGYHSFPWLYAFVYYGEDACQKIRAIIGKTNPMDIEPGQKIVTLRQKYGRNVIVKDEQGRELLDEQSHVLVRFENVIHASFASSAEYEIKLWFSPAELLSNYRIYPTTFDKNFHLIWQTSAEDLRHKLFS